MHKKSEYINAGQYPERAVEKAIEYINAGKIIAIPTETVYGLAVDFNNEQAVQNLFNLKNRPSNNPMTAYIHKLDQLELISDEVPDLFFKLAEKFLPGPLAMVINKKAGISDIITSGLPTIGIRMPDNKITLRILEESGKILAGTSANISGQKAFVNAKEIYNSKELSEGNDFISLVIDDGPSNIGTESTVLSLAGPVPKILRQGAISSAEIEEVTRRKVL